ncbi:hypothetical protein [Deinococcus petrolearius]|uniref:Uncharacterized protein n=1 Tax=Deinococcus petrolearius TaxID=1751295 RepID=A0ABW1DMM0_9DEIO
MLNMKATMLTAHQHETAFAFFNARLFEGQLPDCVISLGSMARAQGMYRFGFYASTGEGRRDEIVMNPETFSDLRDYLSTPFRACGDMGKARPAQRRAEWLGGWGSLGGVLSLTLVG